MLRSFGKRAAFAGASLLVMLACNLGQAAGSPPTSPSTASPAAASVGIPVSATPIRFTIPQGLATGATAETIDVVTDQTGAAWDVAPAHLQLTLQGYALGNSYQVPQFFVYPAQPYAGMNAAAALNLKRLQAILTDPGGSLTPETLPRVPFFNAGQVFAAQPQVIRFTGGSGVRFITQYAQDISPVNNSGLFYHFQALSGDGKYYIVGILPVSLPFLPADNDPGGVVPSGGVPFPSAAAPGSSYESYYRQVTARIDAAAPDQFTPPLSVLDALVRSIQVGASQ